LRFPSTTEEAAGLKKVANRSDDYKNCNEKKYMLCVVMTVQILVRQILILVKTLVKMLFKIHK
jgi:hypothetical protein